MVNSPYMQCRLPSSPIMQECCLPAKCCEHMKEVPPPLRPFFEKIIDKKVNEIALNIFERLIDVVCSYLYSAYNQRLNYRMEQLDSNDCDLEQQVDNDDSVQDTPPTKATAQKVHYFMDGAPLYDRTSNQRVAIESCTRHKTIAQQCGEAQIKIDGKPVFFHPNPNHVVLFGKTYGTKEVIVTDIKECPELVIIYERENSNHLKAWCVDTTQSTKRTLLGGQIVNEMDVFLAEEIASKAPSMPIIIPI